MADKKRCLVVMPAVEQTGLECEEQWGHLPSPAWQRDGA
jgi:hypothetical protein